MATAHPARLGKYEITEVLGEGAMGVVYKGFDPDIRRVVALKTIRQALAGDSVGSAGIAARFRNEAQAGGRLSHPGIVQVYDYGSQEDVAYIAMEFVEGHSLAHYLTHKVRFTDEDIPGLMIQVLDALHHAHEQGVWHRDIKPANIILGRNGRLKIADFGVARIENSGLTQMHTLIGTPACLLAEGLADLGLEVLVGPTPHLAVAPMIRAAGLNYEIEAIDALAGFAEVSGRARGSLAIDLHDRGDGLDTVVDRAQRWLLLDPARARKAVEFLADPSWRAYVFCYAEGHRLCRSFVAGDPGRFARLLDEQLIPADLRPA